MRNLLSFRFTSLLVIVFLFATLTAIGQTGKIENKRYVAMSLRPNLELNTAKDHITQTLKKADVYDIKNKTTGTPKEVLVLDDKIELKFKNQNSIILFSDLINGLIISQQCHKITDDGMHYIRYISELQIPGFIFTFKGVFQCDELANELYFIIQPFKEKQFNVQLELFSPMAAQYRALKEKPIVTEEQRKYIVQANLLNQQKLFEKAIELYNKAIEINPISYPAAYSNVALLSAQIQRYDAAIYNMKKFLLLEPEAADARSGQDKIYEWEIEKTK